MKVNGDGKRLMSEINVVPFVDVMLVLLIIFMVSAPMMLEGLEVDLPRTTARPIKTEDEPMSLTITKEGEIYLEEYTMKLEDLESRVRAIAEYRRDKGILLRADRDVPYGFVIQVVSRLKRAGIERLGMVTEPED